MSDKSKKIFLILTIGGSFIIYSAIYYKQVLKNAPYKFTEFKSFTFKYGHRDSMVNTYNSLTGEYQYLDKHDSLIKIRLFLTRKELLDLHRNAADLGFWDFPSNELDNDTTKINGIKPIRYDIEFNYSRKSKKVLFDVNYIAPQKLVEANKSVIKEIENVLTAAEDRQRSKK